MSLEEALATNVNLLALPYAKYVPEPDTEQQRDIEHDAMVARAWHAYYHDPALHDDVEMAVRVTESVTELDALTKRQCRMTAAVALMLRKESR